MPVNGQYEPSPSDRVRQQVELCEATDGAAGGTLYGNSFSLVSAKRGTSTRPRPTEMIEALAP